MDKHETLEVNKAWTERFLPEIKRILGETFINKAPIGEDLRHNTDLIVLTLDRLRIACRVRRWRYFSQYGSEFTVRSFLPSGAKTELAKIMEGWGDYLFYGFAAADDSCLYAWWIADLGIFRQIISADPALGIVKHNADGSSDLTAFKWHWFPAAFIIKSHVPHRRSPVPIEPWPEKLAEWVQTLKPEDLPAAPFEIRQGVIVTGRERFLTALQADTRRGPDGPRARYGALQSDLRRLAEIGKANHES